MGLEECIQEIMAASANKLTKDEARALLECYKQSTEGFSVKDRFAAIETVLDRARQEMVDGMQVSLLRERATRVRQALIASQTEAKLKAAPQRGNNPIYKAFHNMMLDKESIIENSRLEPTWWFNQKLSENDGQAVIALKTPNMLAEAIDVFFQPRSSRNLTGISEPVKALVSALDSTNDFVYSAANKVGGYLNWRPTTLFSGRVALAEKMGAMPKDTFVEHVAAMMSDDIDTLHQHGIFRHEDLEQRLEKIYDLTTKGSQYDNYSAYADSTNPLVESFYGKTANRLSDSIFDLPFADGAAYRQYFEDFNGGDHAQLLQGQLKQIGRNLGLVRAFGPIPKEGFNFLVSAAKRVATSDAEALRIEGKFAAAAMAENNPKLVRLGAGPVNLDNVGKMLSITKSWLTEPNPETWFKILNGETERVHDQSLANLGRTVRGFTSLSRLLGFGHLTQWGDLPNTFAILSKIDNNPVENFQATLNSYLKAYDPGVKMDADALNALGTAFDVAHGNYLDMYYQGDGNPASPTRQSLFDKGFKYTGMARLDWVRIKMTNEYLNARMASALQGGFETATPELRGMMEKVGLGAEHWEGLQNGVHNVDVLDNKPHLLPEKITDADIRFKYLRMQSEAARIAVPRPGALEQALINRGTSPGTVEGEIMRTIGLFKSFGLAMATRVLPWVGENLTWKGQTAWGLSMMGTYLMRDAVKSYLLGKTPKERDFTKPGTWAEMALYSGMGGVYGDMIGSDMSKFGTMGGAAGALAGPLITGPVQTGIDFWHTMLTNKTAGEKTAKGVQAAMQTIGANNVPLLTPAINRIYLYSMYNWLEPGWMEKHLAGLKSRGQSEF